MARKLAPVAALWIVAGLLAVAPAGAVVPAGFSDVVILGTNSVALDHDVDVTSGDVVANDASAGPTLEDGYELFVDNKSTVAGSLRGDSVAIDKKAAVGGDVAYNDLANDGTISGSELTPLPLPVFGVLPLFHTGPSDGPDVAVDHHQTQTLAAGTYGDVTVAHHATLVLTGGVYDLHSLSAAQNVTIVFEAPSQVRIAERFGIGQNAVVGPADGSGVGADQIVVYVAGINGTDGALGSSPKAAHVGDQSTVSANVYAPNGTLELDHHTNATGVFIGRDVFIGHHSQVALASFFFNLPPVAGDDSATVAEGGSVSTLDSAETSLLANDTDPNADNLSVTATPVTPPVHGALVLNPDGTFTYTHDGSETTADAFEYEVCDDGVEPGPLCDVGAVAITVIPVNDPPTADPQTVTAAAGGPPVTIALTGSDVDGDSLTFSIVNGPSAGTLSGLTSTGPTSATVVYTPGLSFEESDLFEFEVDDGNGGTDTAVVTIIAEEVNDPPTARSDSAFVEPGGTVTTLAGGAASVLANDTDPEGDNLTVTTPQVSGPTHGTLILNADGTFSYTHDGGASTSDGFVYQVCDDGSPVECSTASVSIAIRELEITVTITKSGPGAAESTVISSPAGIDCGTTCSAVFPTSGSISLIAEPAEGFAFDFWTGDADCEDGLLTPSADVACEAVFKVAPPPPVGEATISVTKAGAGTGVVTTSPTGIDCGAVCSALFPAFSNVTLDAVADAGSFFVGFGGDPDCADGVVGTDADKTCIATFNLLPTDTFALTVTKAGSGDGTVASNPIAINCGAICSADFENGTVVTLLVRAEPDSTFIGWSGDCTGVGFSTTVTMDADKTCTANFQ
jgi:VCBS repeat-containing protein